MEPESRLNVCPEKLRFETPRKTAVFFSSKESWYSESREHFKKGKKPFVGRGGLF